MNTDQESRKIWKRPVILAPCILLLVILSALCLLRFGNTQWSQWIYIFQAYKWPGHRKGTIRHPANYTGVWTTWYQNGQKKWEGNYRGGKIVGAVVSWYPSGETLGEEHYQHGKSDGVHISWYKSGKKATESYFKSGQIHGNSTAWYSNGQKRIQTECKNGTPWGAWRSWHDNGTLRSIQHFDNGKKEGRVAFWNEQGEVIADGVYKNDKPFQGTFSERWSEDTLILRYDRGQMLPPKGKNAEQANPADREGRGG